MATHTPMMSTIWFLSEDRVIEGMGVPAQTLMSLHRLLARLLVPHSCRPMHKWGMGVRNSRNVGLRWSGKRGVFVQFTDISGHPLPLSCQKIFHGLAEACVGQPMG